MCRNKSLKYKQLYKKLAEKILLILKPIKSFLKLDYRTLYSVNNKPPKLLFGNNITMRVKDLGVTKKIKRSEGYNQTKHNSANKYSKDYTKSDARCPFIGRGGGISQRSSGKSEQVTVNLNPTVKVSLKHSPQNVYGDNLLTIFMHGRNSHLIKLYYRWF